MYKTSRLYLMTDDLDQCQYTCMTLLRNDKENEEATIMMADLAFRKNDYESAMFHFQQLLTSKPDYWVALARLVEVLFCVFTVLHCTGLRCAGDAADGPPGGGAGLSSEVGRVCRHSRHVRGTFR